MKDKKYDELKSLIRDLEITIGYKVSWSDLYNMEKDIKNIKTKLHQLEQAINGFGHYY